MKLNPNFIINKEFKAYNVFELDIDYKRAYNILSDQINEINTTDELGIKNEGIYLKNLSLPLFSYSPGWNGDISWISAGSKDSFDLFDNCFDSLCIAEKTQDAIKTNEPIIMYSGYLVVRSYGTESYYHCDYNDTGVDALTLITPLQFDEQLGKGHLLFKDVFDKENKYRYQKGKAIIFGSDFLHSTEPFDSQNKFIFLCFTYGSRDLSKWQSIKKTASRQGIAYRHPSGEIIINNKEYEKYF